MEVGAERKWKVEVEVGGGGRGMASLLASLPLAVPAAKRKA